MPTKATRRQQRRHKKKNKRKPMEQDTGPEVDSDPETGSFEAAVLTKAVDVEVERLGSGSPSAPADPGQHMLLFTPGRVPTRVEFTAMAHLAKQKGAGGFAVAVEGHELRRVMFKPEQKPEQKPQ